MIPRYSADMKEVTVATADGTVTAPADRWPLVAESLGLGSWQGEGEEAVFVPLTPDPFVEGFRPLSRKALLLGLLAHGITEAMALAALDGVSDPTLRETYRIEFANTAAYHREHPFIGAFGGLMGLSSQAIDVMWREAQAA
jgi:hypothetical protein